jgi:hypothetical protein
MSALFSIHFLPPFTGVIGCTGLTSGRKAPAQFFHNKLQPGPERLQRHLAWCLKPGASMVCRTETLDKKGRERCATGLQAAWQTARKRNKLKSAEISPGAITPDAEPRKPFDHPRP